MSDIARDDRRGHEERDDRSRQPDAPVAATVSDRRTRRRCPTQWDVRPEGFIEGSSIAVSSTSIAPVVDHAALGIAGGAPSQQTRHARRLYVGGLSEVPEREIEEFFADLVKKSIINKANIRGNPILSVYLNPERKFAFVEFNSIELANAFLDLDGLIFRDQPVKIRRPSDYKPLDLPPELREKKEPLDYSVIPLSSTSSAHALIGSLSSSSGAGSMNRIYLGNIPTGITESQLYELVSTFGALKKLDLVRTPEGIPKGFAFVEFADASMTDTAIAGLNNLALGDRTLTASRAKVSGEGMPAPPLPSSFAPTGPPSRVLCLENMVTAEEVMSDNDYKDILDDISAECAKYGALATVDIPRPPVPGAGRVFLQYADVQGATNAANALAGRQFAGRFIMVQYYDEAALRAGILSQ